MASSSNMTAAVREQLLAAILRGRARKPIQVRTVGKLPFEALTSSGPVRLIVEDLRYQTESGPQGDVPLRIIRRAAESQTQRPVVVLLHGTGGSKADFQEDLEQYATAGYLAAAVDFRYHGDRCFPEANERSPNEPYQNAVRRCWQGTEERPFILDNLWDLLHLFDYLESRVDVDPLRIGMTGISLGGQHCWLYAAVDYRVSVCAPVIAVHSFKWAVCNNQYHARLLVLPQVFATATRDMKKLVPDAQVVEAVWNKIIPGLLDEFDAPFSLPCIAPRPLLIVNGQDDPLTPIKSLHESLQPTKAAYQAANALHNLQVHIEPKCGHETKPAMMQAVRQFFDKHLLS